MSIAGAQEQSVRVGEEAEALARAARQARRADRDLAGALGRPRAPALPGGWQAPLRDALAKQRKLSPTAEAELVAAAQAGDARARAALVEAFLPQVAATARVYRQTPQLERLELLQEGVVGLLRALERYQPDRATPFWSYASWWVRQAMQQLIAELTRPAILSDRALRQLAQLRDAQRQAEEREGRTPTVAELAARTGVPRDRVAALLAADRAPRSLDEPQRDEDGELSTLGELLADPLAEEAYEQVLEATEREEILALLSGLSEREREILRARYGLAGPEQSLAEVGARLGVSAERVRQLERRALSKLRAAARRGSGHLIERSIDL
jgi:RNA polymerase primary sigma factor